MRYLYKFNNKITVVVSLFILNRDTMRIRIFTILSLASLLFCNLSTQAKDDVHAAKGMYPSHNNYTSFFQPTQKINAEVLLHNKGFENDPEIGILFNDAPCQNCYELIGERSLTAKTFAIEGSDGKEIKIQSCTAPLHYKDANGKWRTIHSNLHPSGKPGIYAANETEMPVVVDATTHSVALGMGDRKIEMNRNLELVYLSPDGTERSLGQANWDNYTAGDKGAYVTNAWPGVDIEMYVLRGGVKTNFLINKALPEYSMGKLLVRDHMKMASGLFLFASGHKHHTGNIQVRNTSGNKVYGISAVVAFERSHPESTLSNLEYTLVDNSTLDIGIPGTMLNRAASSYPVIVDPLVMDSTSVTVPGSSYTNTVPYTGGCSVVDNVNVPPAITVTNIAFTFDYVATGGALMSNAGTEFFIGSCKSPAATNYYWYCTVFSPGTCTGTDQTIWPDVQTCIPAPTCSTYVLPVTMNLYQTYTATSACDPTYVYASTPLTIIVSGHTVEMQTSAVTGSATICQYTSTQLHATGHYGVGPYTYTWNPGAITGQTVTVSPSTTTTYTCTITDLCGNSDVGTATVNVITDDNLGFTITPNPGCVNNPITITGLGAGPAASYNWIANGSDHPTVTGTQTWTATYTSAAKYDIILNYQNSFCMFPDTESVIIDPLPIVTAGSNTPVCVGGVLLLNASSNDSVTYSWYGPVGFADTKANPMVTHVNIYEAGNYVVTATNKEGCISVPVTVPVAVVSITLGPITSSQTIHSGSSVQLDISGGLYYTWLPNNGTLSNPNINNPLATPVDSVTTYKAIVMNQYGCKDSATVTITLDYSHDFIPTAFTPNNDGMNDVFRLGNARFDRLADFVIYDRWGNVVFQTNDKTKGWDGTVNGQPADMGVYHYMIMVTEPDNSYKQFKGDVTLIR